MTPKTNPNPEDKADVPAEEWEQKYPLIFGSIGDREDICDDQKNQSEQDVSE